jgi:hypothetical protein
MKSNYFLLLLLMISLNLAAQDSNQRTQKGQPDNSGLPDTDKQTSLNTSGLNIKPGEIIFPNAFKWNRTGPTGGYWTENNVDDCVFRPFQENVINYKLRIFTRQGALIYESTDIHKGWDGYSKSGNLVVQGVYVWMASGKFTDGSYFNKIGDVTFLH